MISCPSRSCNETFAEGTILARHGTEEQRQQLLPGIADGTHKVAFAITEPEAGSNFHRLGTVARRDGDDWVLNGRKCFISGVDGKDTPDYPLGVTFAGRAWSEHTLLRLAYAFEQASNARKPPSL